MRLTKCHVCGGPMEKMATSYICLNCYTKVSDREMLDDAIDRIADVLQAVVAGKDMDAIKAIVNEPFFWESDIEPTPLIYGGEDVPAVNKEEEA